MPTVHPPPMLLSRGDDREQAPDPRTVRRRANRRARSFDGHDPVHREIGRRLIEHLEPIRLAPARILELGCATAGFTTALTKRYPRSEVVALDFAHLRLSVARRRRRRWRRSPNLICADACRLPLPDRCVDLVCANLLLPWIDDVAGLLQECARVMRHGALLACSTLGPDTLKELRALLPAEPPRVHVLPDMHQVADAMVRAGLCDVVADAEMLRAPYRGVADLLEELRLSGSTNALRGRDRTLGSRHALALLLAHGSDASRTFDVTFEAVYLHGWLVDTRSVEVAPPTGDRSAARRAPGLESLP